MVIKALFKMKVKGFSCARRLTRALCCPSTRQPHRARPALRASKAVLADVNNNGEQLSKYIRHCMEDTEGDISQTTTNLSLEETAELKAIVEELEIANEDLKTEMQTLATQLDDLVQAVERAATSAAAASEFQPSSSSSSHRPTTAASPRREKSISPDAEINCSLHHPGALFCTTTSTWRDDDTPAIEAVLEVTASATPDSAQNGHLTSTALDALAANALAEAAINLARRRSQQLRKQETPPAIAATHAEICHILAHGEVVSAQRNPINSPFGHESFVCELRDIRSYSSGRKITALFKPRVPGDSDGWHRAPMEVVAYRLNRLLGMDLIPPSEYRSNGVSLPLNEYNQNGGGYGGGDGRRWFSEGAFMYWAFDARPLGEVPVEQWGIDKTALLSDTRVLDVLLHNSDRHAGHFLMARHWAEGRNINGHWLGDLRPCLIDHAASFRAEAEVCCTHENAFQTGPLKQISAHTMLLLRLLAPTDVEEAAQGQLTRAELAGVATRREQVLRYVEGLVASQGYAATMLP